MRTLAKLAALALFPATLAAQADLTGAGATFPGPIYAKWFTDYAAKTGVKINYQAIGSGGGISQVTAGTARAIANRIVERLGTIRMAGVAATQ